MQINNSQKENPEQLLNVMKKHIAKCSHLKSEPWRDPTLNNNNYDSNNNDSNNIDRNNNYRSKRTTTQEGSWRNVFRPLTCKLKMVYAFKLTHGGQRRWHVASWHSAVGSWQMAVGSWLSRFEPGQHNYSWVPKVENTVMSLRATRKTRSSSKNSESDKMEYKQIKPSEESLS